MVTRALYLAVRRTRPDAESIINRNHSFAAWLRTDITWKASHVD